MSNRLLYGPRFAIGNRAPCWPYALNRASNQARGLVLWLPGDLLTDLRVTDLGPFGLHGAPNSFDVAWEGVNPFGGRAFNLNSSGTSDADYIRIPASPRLTVSDGAGGDAPLSLSFWMILRSYGLSTSFPNFGRMFRSGSRIDMSFSTATLRYEGGTSGTHLEKFGGSASLNTIHHVLATHDGGLAHSGVHIYLDGLEVSYSTQVNGTGTFDSNAASPLDFGESVGTSGGRLFDGLAWDLRMYNRVLSPREAAALYDPETRFELFDEAIPRALWVGAAIAGTTPVSRSLDLRWNLRQQVSRALEAQWSLRALAARALDLRWNIRALAARALDLRWNLRQLASRAATLIWDVESALASVSRSLTAVWNRRAQVSRDADLRWNLRAFVARALDVRWSLRALVSRSLDARWHLRQLAARTAALAWALRTAAARNLDVRWNLRQFAARALEIRYDIEALFTDRPDADGTVTQGPATGGAIDMQPATGGAVCQERCE